MSTVVAESPTNWFT